MRRIGDAVRSIETTEFIARPDGRNQSCQTSVVSRSENTVILSPSVEPVPSRAEVLGIINSVEVPVLG